MATTFHLATLAATMRSVNATVPPCLRRPTLEAIRLIAPDGDRHWAASATRLAPRKHARMPLAVRIVTVTRQIRSCLPIEIAQRRRVDHDPIRDAAWLAVLDRAHQ